MKEFVISIKRLLKIDDAMEYIVIMRKVADVEKLVFDFAALHYAKTLPTAIFARELRLLVGKRCEKGLTTFCGGYDNDKSEALAYLGFIGFFDFIGLPGYGQKVRPVAEVSGANPYLAITKYGYKWFEVQAEYDQFRGVYDYIFEEASKIAMLLEKDKGKNTILRYAICEVLRNAYEHSTSPYFYAMGQTWSDGSAELVIMDDGCGILETLKGKYPYLRGEKEAILESLNPGVSGSDFDNNKYNNSGFGLYVLSELAKRHGHICIASGDCLVRISGEGQRDDRVAHDGTLVGIHLWNIPEDCHEEMKEIVQAGEVISQQGTYPVRPSKETWNF